jgi:hypothetical protein
MERLTALEDLGRTVAAEQDRYLGRRSVTPAARPVFLARAERSSGKRERHSGATWAAGVGALVAAAAVGIALWQRSEPPLTFHVGESPGGRVGDWISVPSGRSTVVGFSDGTEMVLESASRARVVQVDSQGAHVVLESGHAEVHVVPKADARWQVSVGPFVVRVVGTRFDVGWNPEEDALELTLREGQVELSGCVFGEGRSVPVGETVRAWCKAGRFEVEQNVGGPPPASTATARLAAPSPASLPAPSAVVPPASAAGSPVRPLAVASKDWRSFALAGKYSDAFASAESEGFEALCLRGAAEDVSLLGDVARYAGRSDRARAAFRSVRTRFPASEQAALAAFSLARLDFDQSGAFAGAARWFKTYIAERPGGALAREARGRLMESLHRAGDAAGARLAAKEYLSRHASGPHADLARQLADAPISSPRR